MSVYPVQYESDVVVRDGSTLRLRPVRAGDAAALRDFSARLSDESWYLRFFHVRPATLPDTSRVVDVDYDKEFVLVAEAGGRLSGVASYSRDPQSPDRAEVAFTVADVLQGRGAGTRMLEVLAGIRTYLQKHQFDNTETTDLWDALEEATDQPVRRIMDSWIFQGGFPVIDVEIIDDGGTVRLSQQRFRYLDIDDGPDVTEPRWSVPLIMSQERDGAIEFERVLLVSGEAGVTVGTPTVEGAVVHASVVGPASGPKIRVFKMKRRKGYRRTTGHRQHLLRVRIEAISA